MADDAVRNAPTDGASTDRVPVDTDACSSTGTDDTLAIDVPDTSLRDESITIRITGAAPSETVEFDTSMEDPRGVEWRSSAIFTADADGIVDLTKRAPESGSYEGIEPMGWLWSMTATEDASVTGLRRAKQSTVELTATTTEQRAERTITRRLSAPGVDRRPVESDRLAGTLFEPTGAGPHPGVIALHGSGGDPAEDVAGLLASRGYVALALRYFGDAEPIPDELVRVPLSYFETATTWLQSQEIVSDEQIGLFGMSRGGELALLLGSRLDRVGAVVSYVGSGVAYNTPHGPSAWAEDGDPVSHVSATDAHERPGDVGTTPLLTRALETADGATIREATIPIEEADGPILLVSGGNDPVWPSRDLSQIAVERLRARDFAYEFEHLTYDDAGHYITPPYLPKTDPIFGGTPAAMARADEDAWPTALEYLSKRLESNEEGTDD